MSNIHCFAGCFMFSVPAGLAIMAGSLMLLGIAVAAIKPMIWLCKETIKLTVVFLNQIKKLFVAGKKEVN